MSIFAYNEIKSSGHGGLKLKSNILGSVPNKTQVGNREKGYSRYRGIYYGKRMEF